MCSAWRERQGELLTSGAVRRRRQVWNLLGVCRTSMGDIGGGVAAYQRAIALAPDFREAWLNLAQARKEARAPLRLMLAVLHAPVHCAHARAQSSASRLPVQPRNMTGTWPASRRVPSPRGLTIRR